MGGEMTRVVQDADMKTLWVRHPSGRYPIYIGRGLRHEVGARLAGNPYTRSAFIVTDEHVAPLYGEDLVSSLSTAGFTAHLVVVPAGEEHKNLNTVQDLYNAFLDRGIDRSTPVLALGGGVVGDMTGYAAATVLRGVPFIQVPTTLLAMVDASVGGKTGVDMPQGKNLVGAFKFPDMVIVDTETLQTLPREEVACGMAEVIKHGLIADPGLLEMVSAPEEVRDWPSLVARAVQVKIDVVEQDPFEQGRRAVLNLGHTFAHALERVANYKLRHGFAVGLGLIAAARLAVLLGDAREELVDTVIDALRTAHLPLCWSDLDAPGSTPIPSHVWEAMWTDKKRRGKALRFIIPCEPGRVIVRSDVPKSLVLQALDVILC